MLSAQTLYKATQDYFRQNPFKTEFHQFINNLISDPALSEKEIKKKTDTTLFFLQGIYKSHSPFFFPVSRCKVVLAERQEFIDTVTNHVYTYFVYQMIGYAPPGKEGLKDVKEEFERLNRRLKKGLEIIDPKELKRGDAPSGAINNYTYRNLLFYPLTIAWATTAENTENIIALTIRFFMAKNTAYLPIPSNGP
ncbi:MAG: hypothetical protein ABI688_01510 [Bacteroidota bacterium]